MADPEDRKGALSAIAGKIRSAVGGNGSGKPINLALQGGGAHGAFTWGVLDALLSDERLTIESISGTSAGAMNAVVLADGLEEGGPDGARAKLEAFWSSVSAGSAATSAGQIMGKLFSFWQPPGFSTLGFFQQVSGLVSPYRMNPLNINPLKDNLESLVDFDRVGHCQATRLFVSATNVKTGKIKIFTGEEVTADAVMASACLPFLFQAVEVDGEHYWDGGYSGNPALWPFFQNSRSQDILLVQVNPIVRDEVPRTAQQIMERVSEITFNNSLLQEFRAIDFVNRLIDQGRLDLKRYKRNRLHRIDATAPLAAYGASSKLDTSRAFFETLRAHGREAGENWLAKNYDALGKRGTLDLRAEFV